MAVPNKLGCYSDPVDQYSHRVRLVLAEKAVTADMIDVVAGDYPASLTDVNPYGTVPTLVDRDLSLYESTVIMEYLDERYPHPPLLPVYPVARANSRMLMHRIERDWCQLAETILDKNTKDTPRNKARKELRESLTGVAPIFASMPYFMSEEYSLVDCALLPLLWRLPALGVELPKAAAPLIDYMQRNFEREAFRESLSEAELLMRP